MQCRQLRAEKTTSINLCFLHFDLNTLPAVRLKSPPHIGGGAGWQNLRSGAQISSASGMNPGQRHRHDAHCAACRSLHQSSQSASRWQGSWSSRDTLSACTTGSANLSAVALLKSPSPPAIPTFRQAATTTSSMRPGMFWNATRGALPRETKTKLDHVTQRISACAIPWKFVQPQGNARITDTMDTTDKPQLVEHIHKSLTLTV